MSAAIAATRVAHCNVNCSSLERSRSFYEDVVGLTAFTHTNPPLQHAGGFPLSPPGPVVQWDAWMMHDDRGPAGSPALDLLEWKTPAPTGRAYPSANHLGYGRLTYVVPSVDEVFARCNAAGAAVLSAPTSVSLDATGTPKTRSFCALDPDGTCLEFVGHPTVPHTRASCVNVNCTDLGRSSAFYRDTLGLVQVDHLAPGPQSGSVFGLPGECVWEAHVLSLPGQEDVFTVTLVEWKLPAAAGPPYATANNLGIFRMALMVADIEASYEILQGSGVSCPGGPVKLDMGPDVPIDGLWALFFADPDGTCLELIEEPTTGRR